MRSLVVLLLSLPIVGCMQMDTGTQSGAGGDGGVPPTSSAGGAIDGGTSGTGCGTDTQTGITLCVQIDACPGVSVDQGTFPECGFRPGGSLDLECLCPGGVLCPIGVPTSCTEATQLLSQQGSSVQVCQQVSTGTCLPASSGASSGSGSGSSSGGPSPACQSCVQACGGTPSCYEACGC